MRAAAICAVTVTAVSGCFRISRPVGELPPGDWILPLGDPAHAAFTDDRVPASVRTGWRADFGRGLTVPPIVHQDFILTAVSGGVIVTANGENARRHWTRRFNGPIAGQVLRVASRTYFATQHRNGTLYALDLDRGRRLWSRRVGSPAAHAPAYADARLYLATNRDVQAVDATDGSLLWRTRLAAPPVQRPVVLDDDLIVAVRDTLLRIARDDGTIRVRIGLPGRPSAPIAVRGDTLVIAMHPGVIAAYVERGEREIWRHTLSDPVIAAPVVTDEGVFALTRAAALHHLTRHSARRIIALTGAATESLTMTADGALIGTLDGRIVFVRRDGTLVWEERLDGSIRSPAVVRDSAVYVGTLNGTLVKLIQG